MDDSEKAINEAYESVESALRVAQTIEDKLMMGVKYKGFKLNKYIDKKPYGDFPYWCAQKSEKIDDKRKTHKVRLGANTLDFRKKIDEYIREKM